MDALSKLQLGKVGGKGEALNMCASEGGGKRHCGRYLVEEASVTVDAILVDTGEEMPQDHKKLVEFFRQTSLPPCLTHTSPNDSLLRGLNRCSEILARENL